MGQLSQNTTIGGKSLYDILHPVGSIYQTTDADFNPNTEWEGTWEKIVGKFLLSVDPDKDWSTPNLTGGEATHVLSTNEMPSHQHSFKNNSHSFYWDGSGNVHLNSGVMASGTPSGGQLGTLQGNWCAVNNTGGGAAHNNMPPYYTVFTWHRTA